MSGTAFLLPLPRFVAYDPNGTPLAAGILHTYIPNTTTNKETWQDAQQNTPNPNPIILQADGSCLLYGNGTYDLQVTDALGNEIAAYSGRTLAGDGSVGVVSSVLNIAALRAVTIITQTSPALVEGYYVIADGGEGMFVVNPNDTTSADNGGTIILDASNRRWYRETGGQPYSVKWFGAYGNNSTDDSTAIQACLTAATSRGVYFPAGNYICSALAAGQMEIAGAGRYISTLINPSATADTIAATSGFLVIGNLGFGASLTKTAGIFVNFGTNPNCSIDSFFMNNYYVGMSSSGTLNEISNGILENPVTGTADTNTSGGIVIGALASPEAVYISNVVMTAVPGANASFGILVYQSGDLIISDCNIIGHGIDLYVGPVTGQSVTSLWAQNTFFDTANTGILIAPGTGGTVARCRFNGCWTSSHSQNGVTIGNAGGVINGIHFIDHHAILNTSGSGIGLLAGAVDVTVIGGIFASNEYGVFASAGVTDFTVTGASCGNYGDAGGGNSIYGICVAAGASDRYVIALNRVTGNTTGGVADGGSGVNKYVAGNI